MRAIFLLVAAMTLAPSAAAQQSAPAPRAIVRLDPTADEGQRAVAREQLSALMAPYASNQIGEIDDGSLTPGYGSSIALTTDPGHALTFAATCDGECSGLHLQVREPGLPWRYERVDTGAGEAIVILEVGHPEKLYVSATFAACNAPACAYAVGVYDVGVSPRPHPATNPAAKRDSLRAGIDAKGYGEGAKRVGGLKVQDLSDLTPHEFKLMAYRRLARIVGECEGGCGDVSIEIVDDQGATIASGTGAAGSVRLDFAPTAVQFTLRATAKACFGKTCRFGFGVFQK